MWAIYYYCFDVISLANAFQTKEECSAYEISWRFKGYNGQYFIAHFPNAMDYAELPLALDLG